ncbi:hypothetical protein [Erythrobacter oryzae]|uniref:hypothetical protein n=1 Tax=Erythrobacter oryzae TaxID=3019556 RepID=UPI0025564B4E|nr:hypothetical protein [Erythrobacter sp. COR-2]
MSTDRYAGKPFLRLLDSYVLAAIGELPSAQQDSLQSMEPKLHSVYGTKGSWQQIVADQMGFPEDLPETIRAIWDNGVAKMRASGIDAEPSEFVRQFVDTNFPH